MERVHYKYLGVWLTSTLKWSMQVSEVPVCKKKKARQQVGILYQNSTPLQILHHVLLQLVSRARGLYFSLFPQIKKNMAGSQDYILQLYLAYICSHLEYAIYVPLHYCKIVTKKRLFLSLNKAS